MLIISLPLTPSGHHLITEQGAHQCFLIMLSLPSGHHLMMKNLLQEVRTFVLLLFSSFLFCHSGVCLCVSGGGGSLYTASFFYFIFFYIIFCSQAWNLMSWTWVCYFFIPHLRLELHMNPLWLHLEPQLTAVKAGAITKLLQREKARFRAGRAYCKGPKDKIIIPKKEGRTLASRWTRS